MTWPEESWWLQEARQAEEIVEDQGLDLDLRTSGSRGNFPTSRLLVVMITGLDIPNSGVLVEGKLFAYTRQRCPQEAQAQDRTWIVGITPCVCKTFSFLPSPHHPSLCNFSWRNRN